MSVTCRTWNKLCSVRNALTLMYGSVCVCVCVVFSTDYAATWAQNAEFSAVRFYISSRSLSLSSPSLHTPSFPFHISSFLFSKVCATRLFLNLFFNITLTRFLLFMFLSLPSPHLHFYHIHTKRLQQQPNTLDVSSGAVEECCLYSACWQNTQSLFCFGSIQLFIFN